MSQKSRTFAFFGENFSKNFCLQNDSLGIFFMREIDFANRKTLKMPSNQEIFNFHVFQLFSVGIPT